MPSFRCSICLDTLDRAAKPMTTLCGHIYCLDCATFHFGSHSSCAVCRKPQALDGMIRLYPDWETDETRRNASSQAEESISLSPVSVRYMDRAAEGAISSVKQAIAGKEEPEDAVMTCNTFVNSVTDRESPHINTELLREISFQLTLMSTKMKDEHTRLKSKIKKAQRSSDAKTLMEREQARLALGRLEKLNEHLSSQVSTMREQLATLEGQYHNASEDANKQRVYASQLAARLGEIEEELKDSRQQALRAKKKYLVLKEKVQQAKRAGTDESRRGSSGDAASDLLVVG